MRAGVLAVFASVLAAVVLVGTASAHVVSRPRIAALQVALHERGLYAGPIDGIVGPKTVRGVRRFQRRAGLQVDGVAGPRTRRALGRFARHRYGSRIMRRGMRGWDVAVLQFVLRRRGVSVGGVDGHFGPRTKRAVRRFQRRAGLTADGIVGSATFAALASGRRAHARPMSPSQVRATINFWARHYGVNPRLARALAWIESGFQTHVRSSAGARGVMQVTPATWRFVETILIGRHIPRNPRGNIRIGVAYLDFLIRDFRGNVRLALCAYNQGPWSVRSRGPYRQTRRFAADVLAVRGYV